MIHQELRRALQHLRGQHLPITTYSGCWFCRRRKQNREKAKS